MRKEEKKTKFAFAVYDGVIQGTYEIQSWFEAGSTSASGRTDIERWKKIPRYEFVGNISMEMRKKYLHKSARRLLESESTKSNEIYLLKIPQLEVEVKNVGAEGFEPPTPSV